MKARYFLLTLLLVASSAFADSIAHQGRDWVRITALPCTDAKVLAYLTAAKEDQLDYHAARAEFGGHGFAGCWRPIFDKHVIQLQYEDGDEGEIPFMDLELAKEA